MIVLYTILAAIIALILYIRYHPIFGGRITPNEQSRIEQSSNYRNGAFRNLSRSHILMSGSKVPELIKEKVNNRKAQKPKQNIDLIPFDKVSFLSGDKPKFIWYGHSTLLFRIGGLTIAVDPMFGDDVIPLLPISRKRFTKGITDVIDELPPIDVALLTHDHYDHLDYKSIKKIKSKVKHFYGPLGIARHLIRWGVDASKITELDWYNKIEVSDIHIIFTPSKHYAGRGLSDRNQALWGGWILKSKLISTYITGDGGYAPEFKKIGEKYGPFDWCFAECGQYNALWRDNHMFPEDSAQAAIDSQAKYAIPIHWAGFVLAMHSWKEPAEVFTDSLLDSEVQVCVPRLGAIVELGKESDESNDWYKSVE